MEHRINSTLLRGRVRVHLVGVGGNGAQMAHCLARLDLALRALGEVWPEPVPVEPDDAGHEVRR